MSKSNQINLDFLYSESDIRSNNLNIKTENSNQIGGLRQKLNEVDLTFLHSESNNLNNSNQIKTNNVTYSETSDYMLDGNNSETSNYGMVGAGNKNVAYSETSDISINQLKRNNKQLGGSSNRIISTINLNKIANEYLKSQSLHGGAKDDEDDDDEDDEDEDDDDEDDDTNSSNSSSSKPKSKSTVKPPKHADSSSKRLTKNYTKQNRLSDSPDSSESNLSESDSSNESDSIQHFISSNHNKVKQVFSDSISSEHSGGSSKSYSTNSDSNTESESNYLQSDSINTSSINLVSFEDPPIKSSKKNRNSAY